MSEPESNASSTQSDQLSPGARQWLQEHFQVIERKVIAEALSIAKRDQREIIEPRDISTAAMEYAPGRLFPNEPGFGQRILASLSGITLMSAILVVAFGFIGVMYNQAGYTDIVKLFAGAIVGSTGAGVAAAATRR